MSLKAPFIHLSVWLRFALSLLALDTSFRKNDHRFILASFFYKVGLFCVLLCGLEPSIISAAEPRTDSTFTDANWIRMANVPGANGPVYAVALDGSGSLYIGGTFNAVGGTVVTNIAKWDGTNWSSLGAGMDQAVSSLVFSGNDLYAGGSFTNASGISANHVAKWNGTNWNSLGSGMDGNVTSLAVLGGDLYAGGSFTNVDGNAAPSIARWNGTNWSALGSGMDAAVNVLAVNDNTLYAAGPFTQAGGISAKMIAKWDGSSWSALGSGIEGEVYLNGRYYGPEVSALAVFGGNLYAGGTFATAGGNPAFCLAKWNGNNWSALGTGIDDRVNALVVSGGDLYVFPADIGFDGFHINKWDGTGWDETKSTDLSAKINGVAFAVVADGSNMYVGGNFEPFGTEASNIAKWDGSSWARLSSGVRGEVWALAVSGNDWYAGGTLRTEDDSYLSNNVKWNGDDWNLLGSEINDGPIYALAVLGADLYAGGGFIDPTGSPLKGITKWNGSKWSVLAEGITGQNSKPGWATEIFALAASGTNLYVGGIFSPVGMSNINGIARWDGNSWSGLGTGITGPPEPGFVQALAVSDNDVYAGGAFTSIGGIEAYHVAKWDGTNWSALGSGISEEGINVEVNAMAFMGNDLYAAGRFTAAGGIPANKIAKWDGTSWSALGAGIDEGDGNGEISALAVSGSDLYVGGYFHTAGGKPANYIAKWDGSRWSPLGSGTDGFITSLVVSGNELFVGGTFTKAGGKVSSLTARAYIGPDLPALSVVPSGANVTLSWPSFFDHFQLQQRSGLANPAGWSVANQSPILNGTTQSVTLPVTSAGQFFRLIDK